MDVPPFINIGGTCPPCPIGIDAPDGTPSYPEEWEGEGREEKNREGEENEGGKKRREEEKCLLTLYFPFGCATELVNLSSQANRGLLWSTWHTTWWLVPDIVASS